MTPTLFFAVDAAPSSPITMPVAIVAVFSLACLTYLIKILLASGQNTVSQDLLPPEKDMNYYSHTLPVVGSGADGKMKTLDDLRKEVEDHVKKHPLHKYVSVTHSPITKIEGVDKIAEPAASKKVIIKPVVSKSKTKIKKSVPVTFSAPYTKTVNRSKKKS